MVICEKFLFILFSEHRSKQSLVRYVHKKIPAEAGKVKQVALASPEAFTGDWPVKRWRI